MKKNLPQLILTMLFCLSACTQGCQLMEAIILDISDLAGLHIDDKTTNLYRTQFVVAICPIFDSS